MISTKENRFSIRTTAQEKELISRAAVKSNLTISQFVLNHAVDAAKAMEMDNASFLVPKDRYEQFLAALDEKPRSIPALRVLLSNKV